MDILVKVADDKDLQYAETVCLMMKEAAQARGTGIAQRNPEYIKTKITEGKAVIALLKDKVAGFCYIESWGHNKYVANSGLIVHPDYRQTGLARTIKKEIFNLSRKKYPDAKIFGITTSLAVMKINSDMGYKPVPFSELTTDENFWKGCQSCVNYDILTRTNRQHCLCTGMLYEAKQEEKKAASEIKADKYDRWEKFKRFLRFRQITADRKKDHLKTFKVA